MRRESISSPRKYKVDFYCIRYIGTGGNPRDDRINDEKEEGRGDMVKTRKKQPGRHSGGKKWWGCLFVLGTGFLVALLIYQNQLLKKMEKQGERCLVVTGMENSDTFSFLHQEKQSKSSLLSLVAPVVDYLVDEGGTLSARSDESVEQLAALFPGKSSRKIFWSGAGCEMYQSRQTFEVIETEIALAEQSDEDVRESDENSGEDTEEKENSESAVETGAQVSFTENDEWEESEAAALAENEQYVRQKQQEEMQEENLVDSRENLLSNHKKIKQLQRTQSLSYLLKNFYIVDSSTSIDRSVFDVETLLNTKVTLKKTNEPQILIFHTHGASERFVDSNPEKKEESVVGVGSYLAEILEDKYGYQVIHDDTEYDRINGRIDRNKAYNKAYQGLKANLKKYPSIQVVIDLHRDGVGNNVHRLTTVNGKKTAQVMFFNGLSRNKNGNIKYLKNENLQSNLAFSLQMKLKCMELYSDFAKPVYLKSYRYNLHLRKRSTLIELGNENNTLQEAKNAMEPLAKVINEVLSEK